MTIDRPARLSRESLGRRSKVLSRPRVAPRLRQATFRFALSSHSRSSHKSCSQALLDAPEPSTRSGTRDRAMLHVCFAAGLRVSELVSLRLDELQTHPQTSIRIRGKGRRERILPLWKETAQVLRAWIAVRPKTTAVELFLNAQGEVMTRYGFEYILAKHVKTATIVCPSIGSKRVSPHVLRHTCAMHTLQATHDVRKVSLWLGHASVKSTEVYLRADPTEKLEALEAGVAPSLRRGQFKAPDKLLDMLRSK